MILVRRIIHGVHAHFPARVGEWVLAAMLTDWGYRLLQPDIMFETNLGFRWMTWIASETTWGTIAVMVGIARLIALIVNGTFATTWYGRWSPHIRSGMAFLSIFAWVMISLSIAAAGINTTDLSIYPYLAAFDMFNAVRAAQDAGTMDKAFQDAGRIASRS